MKKDHDLIYRQAAIDKAIMIPVARIVTEDKVLWRKAVFVEDIEALPAKEPDISCDGCRYGYFGSAACDRCSRMYMDRYEREENKDAVD